MTLQLCVSPCALVDHEGVVRGSPDPAHLTTEGLPIFSADDIPPPIEPAEFPDDDGEWEEFDPASLESWILDDFDWDVEESYPQRGDYWDDSLDGEWDLAAAAAAMTNTEVRMTKQFRMTNNEGVCWPVLHVPALC